MTLATGQLTPLEILLLIEDDDNDIILTKRVIQAINANIHIIVQTSGESALAYLETANHIPQLILLDLGLPKMDGMDFIKLLKETKRFRSIPIVILTGLVKDVITAFNEKVANGYIIKPIERDEFQIILSQLGLSV